MAIHSLTHQRPVSKMLLQQSLKPGQFLQGKVLKLYPNQRALIQFGETAMHAQLKAPLTRGERYHFKVEQTSGTVVLKVVGDSLGSRPDQNAAVLLNELGLAVNRHRIDFINALAREHIPFKQGDLFKAFELMNSSSQSVQTSLKQMINDRLPLTQSVLNAVEITRSSTLSGEGKTFNEYLQQHSDKTQTHQVLADKLTHLLDREMASFKETFPIQSRFLSHVQTMLQEAGLSHEYVASRNPETAEATIKSLLIQLIQQDQSISERALPLLHLINGLQLDSVQETPYTLQAMLQLPGDKLGLPDDIAMEFSGRKQADGSINSDDCTIFFHLNLANMQTTIIDMHIQKRTVGLTVWTDSDVKDQAVHGLKPTLTKGLEDLDYHLSSIKFQPLKQSSEEAETSPVYNNDSWSSREGVDFRI